MLVISFYLHVLDVTCGVLRVISVSGVGLWQGLLAYVQSFLMVAC
jgi:hypothetical protein